MRGLGVSRRAIAPTLWLMPLVALGLAGCGEHSLLPPNADIGPTPQIVKPVKSAIPTVNVAPAVGWSAGETPTAAPGLAVTAFAAGLRQTVGGGQRLISRRYFRRRLLGCLCCEQGGLNTMTQSLARALAPLIRVNTVCPGYIDTPWFTKGRGEAGAKAVRDNVIAKVPLKVASTADDIAQLVCFLASPASSNMTGEFVRMDAGMHLVL